jgi:DNA-binding HxlR family transcriptional regulator
MRRKRFDQMNCGIAQALEAFGDWWTLLIVRDAFFGARRFGDFQRSLGIAKNILSARLAHLVEHGIFERVDVGSEGERFEYRLTAKGEALLTVLTALREWSDEWVFGRGNEPVVVRDRRTGRRIAKLRVTDADGAPLKRSDLRALAGPGASRETIRQLSPCNMYGTRRRGNAEVGCRFARASSPPRLQDEIERAWLRAGSA